MVSRQMDLMNDRGSVLVARSSLQCHNRGGQQIYWFHSFISVVDTSCFVMSDHPSDYELADLDEDGYRLAEAEAKPVERKMPREYENAVKKIEALPREPPPVRKYQFTIRDMLVLTAVVAFLMGLIVSINRGMSVFLMYSIFFLLVLVAWFAHGLWKSGYWRKREAAPEDPADAGSPVKPKLIGAPSAWLQYSLVDLALIVSAFAFLLSLCSLFPGEHKLANAAGITGFGTLLGLLVLSLSETRRPLFVMFWWLMFLVYLATSAAVVVMG
jgi:hypothetical protein